MRGGPIDLTPFGALLTGIGWLYWLLAVAGLWWALRGKRPWKTKLLRALPIVLLFGLLPGLSAWQGFQQRLRLDAAMTLFEERCKTAGEKTSRSVENVDGIVWMKWREEYSNRDGFADQWKLNDPYGRDCGLEECIEALLRVSEGQAHNPEGAKRHAGGFRFVETLDPRDGRRYRYTATLRLDTESGQRLQETGVQPPAYQFRFQAERVPIEAFSARYGVAWDDISTREDREHWIAGGSMKVIDLQTNEVLGERIGYMVERGQGSRAGNRMPWLFAVQNACPAFPTYPNDSRRGRTRREALNFIEKIVRPSKGE